MIQDNRPPQGTSSAPIFVESAEEVIRRLAPISTPEAAMLVHEAKRLSEEFRTWEKVRPEDGVRLAMIRSIFELHRKAMDYLARRGA
jgi:hypothetical protein